MGMTCRQLIDTKTWEAGDFLCHCMYQWDMGLHIFVYSHIYSIHTQIDRTTNAKLSLYLIKHHAMKTYGGVELQRHVFLTSALDGD